MALTLYAHPFSSYCQKVLMALWENATPFTYRHLEEPGAGEELARLWPIRKFPVLVDGHQTIVETSIIIEYLDLHHPGTVRFLPEDPAEALEVRLLDRFFDQYVMNAAQVAVNEALRKVPDRLDEAKNSAASALETAYACWSSGWAGANGRREMNFRWPTALLRHHYSTATGFIRLAMPIPNFGRIERDCSPGPRLPELWRRGASTDPTSHSAHRIGTDNKRSKSTCSLHGQDYRLCLCCKQKGKPMADKSTAPRLDVAANELGAPALRAFLGLARAWKLSEQEQMKLLGLASRSTLHSWKGGRVSKVSRDTIERISYLLGIFKAINILLPDQARADAWMRAPNKAPPFGGRSALDRMTSGNIGDLYAVRQFLDAQRG